MNIRSSSVASPLALILTCLPVLAQQDAAGTERLRYEDTRKQISWVGRPPAARLAWDGEHVLLMQGKKEIWFDPATGELVEAQKKPAAAAGDAAASEPRKVVRLFENDVYVDTAAGPAPSGRGRGARRPRGPRKPGPGAVRLTTDGADADKREQARLAPGGAHLSFVDGGDLVILAADGGGRWDVTDDGGPDRFHGVLDWVYQEEIYGRGNFQGHWWSPDGSKVAFLSLDEEPVREFVVINHVPQGFLDRERAVEAEVTNYPKAGDPNPRASLSIADATSETVVPIDLSGYPDDVLVVRVEWAADDQLLVTLQDRIQTWAELCAVDPATGAVERWIREESKTWVNRPSSPRWLDDGTFLWLSERTGYQHVYHYDRGGELIRPVTAGEWQVRRIARIDEDRGLLWFEGTKDGATGRHYYRTGLDGEGLTLLTPGVGTHSMQLSEDGSFLIDIWSAVDRPPTVRVLSGVDGKVLREVGQASRGQASKYAFSPKERLTIPARDGYELDATLILPTDHEPGKPFPIHLPTYSGPDAPSVRDSWSYSTYQQFLAQQGFGILQVNVRSASGRGQAHTGLCYQQLGKVELQDLEDAVDWVVKERSGDPTRVAIEGWSYGGFMAAYALTHSDKFALGLAGAGVHDWRLYDTIYTERYMRTPQENKKGYDETSVIKGAKNLKGHLVILHGTMDDNVHMQNSMQLVWELQKAGKQDFEMMFYPRSRHGLSREVSQHRRDYQWRALQRLLEASDD